MSLAERVAVVTGAARSLGAAIAEELHRRGATVVLADIEDAGPQAKKIDAGGERAWAVAVDVRDREAVNALVEETVRRSGRVDVLVNNAALTPTGSLWDVEADEWDDVLAVNLRGPLFAIQAAGPRMRAQGWGRIVNVASDAGQVGGTVAGPHYSASKARLLVLTKIAARELAPHGVTVNAIAPAAIESPILDALPPETRERMAGSIPVGRLGRPEEVAALVAYLASDEAAYVTGATFDLNGGLLMR
jgi:3-oxoacyl-[acyl-carrier protein] reductase